MHCHGRLDQAFEKPVSGPALGDPTLFPIIVGGEKGPPIKRLNTAQVGRRVIYIAHERSFRAFSFSWPRPPLFPQVQASLLAQFTGSEGLYARRLPMANAMPLDRTAGQGGECGRLPEKCSQAVFSPLKILSRGRSMAVITDAKKYAAEVARLLKKHYPDAKCSLNFSTPLELLVATILSAQCTDQRVNLVTKELFRKYRTVRAYAESPPKELENAIQSTGFFHNKTKSIQGCCHALLESYKGEIPKDLDKLVDLPGIGRKTANVVLGTAFGVASGVVVDTHVARVSQRLGLTKEKIPEKIEQDLMRLFPRKEWIVFSHRMIQHGRKICVARKPLCEKCPLEAICPKIGVERK
jgi:endonuclease-3